MKLSALCRRLLKWRFAKRDAGRSRIAGLAFSFPLERTWEALDAEIIKLEAHFEVSRDEVMKVKRRLDAIRAKLKTLDEWTWRERLVTGKENHIWLVNSSDFWGDPDRFEEELDSFLRDAANRDPIPYGLRCAYLGVPPIYRDIYDSIVQQGADVLYNEVQRQFAMPSLLPDIVDQYLAYTYPYSVFERLEDILPQLSQRRIDVVISYTQSFCHLQIDNILLKKHIDLPFLTLEGDQPEALDNRTLLRLESFSRCTDEAGSAGHERWYRFRCERRFASGTRFRSDGCHDASV